MEFYLIGIGGAGMSVVAQLLLAQGHQVSGSDRKLNKATDALVAAGAQVFAGHDAAQVPPQAIVVRSSAIKPDNPEYAVALERGQEIWHRSQALAFASRNQDFIAVAGAHGKTSTSAMIARTLDALGADPSRAIGGSLAGGLPGGYLGTGTMLVAEADESDGSFLNYTPRIALVTNIEPDHLDHYGTAEAFEEAFVDFTRRIVPNGLLVACADHPGSRALALAARLAGIRTVTYGREESTTDHVHLHDTTVTYNGKSYQINLSVPGEHMLLNAAGAWAVCHELGYDGDDIGRALAAFGGTARRFDLRGTEAGVAVIDDYAHHPAEVAVTLATARKETKGAVRVLFQPHLYSRTQNFAREFATALDSADSVIVTSVFPAREVPEDGLEGDAIVAYSEKAIFEPDMEVAARMIAGQAADGDLILTMGAGDVTELPPIILEELAKR
ncbi:MAG: UDP-N-acetylmuramate--L-alanine ligase [Actinomycetaceae bacterium]|nr:UDP-N-acetylmuramate--L-alanine ligase [Actinomycetaceae bacterium]